MNREIRIFFDDGTYHTFELAQAISFGDGSESKVKEIITVDYSTESVLSVCIIFENGQSFEYAGFKYVCKKIKR